MTESLYERYKDALRRGHVASVKARPDAALEAYGEAARLAPDRALPLVGIGTVLARLGKPDEALTAFDAALERAPTDEAALRARADILMGRHDRAAAAETLDRLAAALEAAGRPAEALDAAIRGLDLAESRSRRAAVTAMVDRFAGDTHDPSVAAAQERARAMLTGSDASSVPTTPAVPPFNAPTAVAAVEGAAEVGDPDATRELALVAAAGLRANGQLQAAIDVCYLALASSPADPGLHLSLAEVYLDLGWRTLASDKLVLLARLAALTDDVATRAQLCRIATDRLPDDEALIALCA